LNPDSFCRLHGLFFGSCTISKLINNFNN